ncbi:MAG: helix-hairpin-helix domain-containing protein [Chitinophagales bacterium]|nr:helix-hairpin-helix domain-containing protein [Bacteroidota bacterium]MCB9043530.1 helix-hairpin-helix domain-containing protein [Chitinophagales bacterium]
MLNKKLFVLVCICLLCLVNRVAAQQVPLTYDKFEQLLEDLAPEDENLDYDAWFEYLSALQQDPIDLNAANYDELIEMRLLSDQQVNGVLYYRDYVGGFYNIYELQAVPELDLEAIRRILPFVKVKGSLTDFHIPFKDQLYKGDHQFFVRYTHLLQVRDGYKYNDESEPYYLGSPDKIYARYRYKYGTRLSYGITAEKDPGEEFFKGTEKRGFDFYSAHFFKKGDGLLQTLALGDYEVRFGQGLIMWGGLAFGKSVETIQIAHQGQTLRPYTSVAESQFMRGAAATLKKNNWEATLFASYKPIDRSATVDTLAIDDAGEIDGEVIIDDSGDNVTFYGYTQDGLHNTLTKIERRHALHQTDAGLRLAYNKRNLELAVNGVYTAFDENINLRTDALYTQYRFQGKSWSAASFDYRRVWRNFNLFGEWTLQSDNAYAFTNGVMMSLHPNLDISLLHRHFDKTYNSFYGAVFAESNSNPAGESGLFLGIAARPFPQWKINAYYDLYQYSWLRYGVNAPSRGHDRFVQLTYTPSRQLEIYLRYKSETKQANVSSAVLQTLQEEDNNDILQPFVQEETNNHWRLQVRYKPDKNWSLRARASGTNLLTPTAPTQTGYLVFQDIAYQPLGKPYDFTLRYALFDTETYDVRQFAFENDVLYSYSIPAYNGRGSRYYILVRYTLARSIDLWLRYAQTTYDDRDVISSGYNEIIGNKQSEIKAQIRFKF